MPKVSASLSARDHDAPDHQGPDAHGRATIDGHDAQGRAMPGGHDADTRPSPASSASDPETLDRYAAAGGMAPDRIRRILADLVPALEPLHRAGRAHGGISPSAIGLDATGRARLLTPPLSPAANAEDAPRRDGYAAFEQYTDDPDTPCGPWTDIYALSATACALLTGLAPPSALARCVRDDYVSLAQRRSQEEQAFCVVLDSGLSLDAYARPQAIDEFARALRLDLPAPVPKPPAVAPLPAVAPPPTVSTAPAVSSPPAVHPLPAEPHSMLEDADGLEATSAWASAQAASGGTQTPGISEAAAMGATAAATTDQHVRDMRREAVRPTPQPPSQVTVYREGQVTEARTGTGQAAQHAPERDPVAVQYEEAVAAMHTRKDPQPSHAERAQVPPVEKSPYRHCGHQRQRAPLLMILAVIAMVAATFYMWLRPQPTPRGNVVASASNTASGGARAPASNSAADNKPASGMAGGPAGTASNGASGNATTAATGNASNGAVGNGSGSSAGNGSTNSAGNVPGNAAGNAPDSAAGNASGSTPGAVSPGASNNASNGTSGDASGYASNGMSAGTNASPSPGAGNSMSSGAMSANPGTAGAAGGTPSNAMPAAPGAGEQGIATRTVPNQTIATVDLSKPNSATPADAAAKARTASKAPVAVAIAVRPWGEVLVNGKSRGVSPPLNNLTLAPGTYDITIRNNAGPDVHQSLTVSAGKSATISHTFH